MIIDLRHKFSFGKNTKNRALPAYQRSPNPAGAKSKKYQVIRIPAKQGFRGYVEQSDSQHSISMHQILSALPSSLQREMADKVDSRMMADVFRRLEPKSFHPEYEKLRIAREDAVEKLKQSADAIWPHLWHKGFANAEMIVDAVKARDRIEKLFDNVDELNLFTDAINHINGLSNNHFPGWLVVENCEPLLRKIRKSHGPLTAQKVFNESVVEKVSGGKKLIKMHTYLKALTLKLARERTETGAGHGEQLSTYGILKRVDRKPDLYKVPKAAAGGVQNIIGNSVNFGNKTSSVIITLPGGLDIFQLPNGNLVAVYGGKSQKLVGLSEREQHFLLPLFRKELARNKLRLKKEQQDPFDS